MRQFGIEGACVAWCAAAWLAPSPTWVFVRSAGTWHMKPHDAAADRFIPSSTARPAAPARTSCLCAGTWSYPACSPTRGHDRAVARNLAACTVRSAVCACGGEDSLITAKPALVKQATDIDATWPHFAWAWRNGVSRSEDGTQAQSGRQECRGAQTGGREGMTFAGPARRLHGTDSAGRSQLFGRSSGLPSRQSGQASAGYEGTSSVRRAFSGTPRSTWPPVRSAMMPTP